MKQDLTLLLDTALHCAQAAVFEGETCLAEISKTGERGQAEVLLPVVEETLRAADRNWKDLSNIIVTVGPGVFTGIRSGIAAARAMRLALGIPVTGVSTLHLLATSARHEGNMLALIDAHKDEAYAQLFSAALKPLAAPVLLKTADVGTMIQKADTVIAYPAAFARQLGEKVLKPIQPVERPVEKLNLKLARMCAALQPLEPTPLYVRAPDALPQQNGLLQRA